MQAKAPTGQAIVTQSIWARLHGAFRQPLLLALVAAATFGVAARILYAGYLPLWFDETFTAVITTQPTFTTLVRWCLTELSGPGFYMPLWLWVRLAGSSDAALRLPGLFMAIAAPLILAWRGHPNRKIRFGWAILAFLSTPMIVAATEARPYPQLFLLGCLQAMAFLRIMRAPTIRSVSVWSVVSALLVLTHYYSAILAGVEGLVFLAIHRRAAMRCWPALLPFVPVAVWLNFHLRFLLAFAATLNATATPTPWYLMVSGFLALIGAGQILGLIVIAIVAASSLWTLLDQSSPLKRIVTPDRALIYAGLLTLVVFVGIGILRPGFSSRYLTPALPIWLFGLTLWAWAMFARYPLVVMAVMVSLVVGGVGTLQAGTIDPQFDTRQRLSFEGASTWMAERHPQRLVFLWQSPGGAFGDAQNLRELGGFFFRRLGQSIPVNLVRQVYGDPNDAVLTAAGEGLAAILWLRDPNTRGKKPAIAQRHAGWECRDFGSGDIMVYACRRP